MRPRIADSFVPSVYSEMLGAGAVGTLAGRSFPAANRAVHVPVMWPWPCQLYSLTVIAANGTGNYDLGFYDGYSKNLIASAGSTAMTAAGAKTLTFSRDIRVDAGKVYYAAVAGSSTSGQVEGFNTGILGLISIGMGQQASALPLPSTMTPATVATGFMPLFVFGVR
jgi:hypothetical protein